MTGLMRSHAGKLDFSVRSGWGRFETKGRTGLKRRTVGDLGDAGLWKPAGERGVFDLPPTVMARAHSDTSLCEPLARWAVTTARGKADASWSPPPREEVERWLPDQALTLQVGTIARQGVMTLDEGRLAFSFPVVPRVAETLPGRRRELLLDLLDDGQKSWRLVRVGMAGPSEARGEVDLTGAPAEVLEDLVRIGVDALRLVVSALVEPADFIVNGAETCRALEIGSFGRSPSKRRKGGKRR